MSLLGGLRFYPLLLIALTCLAHWQIHSSLTALNYARPHADLDDFGESRQGRDYRNSKPTARKALTESYVTADLEKSQQQTIFVSIAAYRDDECKDTINDMFTTALFPERIQVTSTFRFPSTASRQGGCLCVPCISL